LVIELAELWFNHVCIPSIGDKFGELGNLRKCRGGY